MDPPTNTGSGGGGGGSGHTMDNDEAKLINSAVAESKLVSAVSEPANDATVATINIIAPSSTTSAAITDGNASLLATTPPIVVPQFVATSPSIAPTSALSSVPVSPIPEPSSSTTVNDTKGTPIDTTSTTANGAANSSKSSSRKSSTKAAKPSKPIPAVPESNPINPMIGISFWNYLSWRWVQSLLDRGNSRQLQGNDLWQLPREDSAQYLTNKLHALWDKELAANPLNPSLIKCYRQTFGSGMALHQFLGLWESVARIAAVIFIGQLIIYFADFRVAYNAGNETPPIGRGLGWCAAFCITNAFLVPFHHIFFWHGYRFGMRLKQATIGLIYRKAIQLSNGALLSTTGGQVANLISNDVYRFEKFALYWPFFTLGPFEAAVGLYILWRQVGVSSLAGLGVLLCFIPFQAWFGRMFGGLRRKSSLITDERVKLMTEIISGMRIMKMFAWEPSYAERVEGVRATEMEKVHQAGRLKGANMGISFGSSPVICLATFLTFFFTSSISDFSADRIFVTLSLFGLIRLTMTLFFPMAVEGTSEIRVSIQRIQNFLLLDNFQRAGAGNNLLTHTTGAGNGAGAGGGGGNNGNGGNDANNINGNNGGSGGALPGIIDKELAIVVAKRKLNFLSECTPYEEIPKSWPIHYNEPFIQLRGVWAWWLRQGKPLGDYSVQPSPVMHPRIIGQQNGQDPPLLSNITPIVASSSSAAGASENMVTPMTRGPTVANGQPLPTLQSFSSAHPTTHHAASSSAAGGAASAAIASHSGARFSSNARKSSVLLPPLPSIENSLPTHLRNKSSRTGANGLPYLSSAPAADPSPTGSSAPLPPPPPPPAAPAPVASGDTTFVDLGNNTDNERKGARDGAVTMTHYVGAAYAVASTPSNANNGSNGVSPANKARKDMPTLVDISMDVRAGQLCAIVGPVGAGKSSILMTILSELTPHRGLVNVRGSTAYAAQQPWIMSGTVKSNVLMGLPYDEEKFQRAVIACALEKDIIGFDNGIQTIIGERGITLSGGQRARLALARAVYHDADIYLLDDPLSAVDPGVARHLFDQCIRGALRDKVVILVTHQLQFVEQADKIMVLTGAGVVAGFGSFHELQQRGLNFAEIIASMQDDHIKEDEPATVVKKEEKVIAKAIGASTAAGASVGVINGKDNNKDNSKDAAPKAEQRSEGAVTLSTYSTYMRASGGCCSIFITIILCLVAPTALVMTDWWLAHWLGMTADNRAKNENAIIYAVLVGVTLLVCVGRAMILFRNLLGASQTLHKLMLRRIVRVPIAFFDANPVGRILNRFSNDVGMLDDALPFVIVDCLGNVSQCIGVVALVCAINPYVLIPLVPLAWASAYYRRAYISTSREVKRLESMSRSPVHSDFAASLDGLATIRAYNSEPYFIREFMKHQDDNGRGFWAFLVTNRWIGVRLDGVSVLFIIAVTFFLVIVRDSVSPALVGLSLTYALNMMGCFQWAVRTTTEVENQMVAVERVIQYSQLPMEPSLYTEPPNIAPSSDWPTNGEVIAKDLQLRYAPELPLVIKGISFHLHARDKIGIVGRTGSGKTSLMSCLFRLVEWGGDIIIDGVPIKNIGLHELRSKLSVIPQEPTLFSGTIRKNLDPFNQCSDSQLWDALEQVQMRTAVKQLPKQLSAPLSEGGSNLSVGQRQLLCLARAITRRSRLLIMDEATANVDLDTDAIIQRTIRSQFQDCTVVVIAHRLNTIMDSDRVMVLDHGHMLEFDVPHRLLGKANGALAKMVNETGAGMARELRRLAYNKWQTLRPDRGGPLPNELVQPITSPIPPSAHHHSSSSDDHTSDVAAPPPALPPSSAAAAASSLASQAR